MIYNVYELNIANILHLNFKASFTLHICICVYVFVCIKFQHCVYGMLRQMQRIGIEPILCICIKLQTKM